MTWTMRYKDGLHFQSFKQRGLTLIELLVTITIIGILAGIAVPSYQSIIEKNRLQAAVETFKSDLQLAHSEAIKQNQNVVFNTSSGNSGTWCYGIAPNTCDCSETDNTEADFCSFKRLDGSQFSTTNLATTGNTEFEFRRGTRTASSSASSYTLSSTNLSAAISVNAVGRVSAIGP